MVELTHQFRVRCGKPKSQYAQIPTESGIHISIGDLRVPLQGRGVATAPSLPIMSVSGADSHLPPSCVDLYISNISEVRTSNLDAHCTAERRLPFDEGRYSTRTPIGIGQYDPDKQRRHARQVEAIIGLRPT